MLGPSPQVPAFTHSDRVALQLVRLRSAATALPCDYEASPDIHRHLVPPRQPSLVEARPRTFTLIFHGTLSSRHYAMAASGSS